MHHRDGPVEAEVAVPAEPGVPGPAGQPGQAGVERALELMRIELERDMRLMGCTSVAQLSRANLRFR